MEQQYGRAGDQASCGAEKDLRQALPAICRSLPGVARHCTDVSIPREVVPEIPFVGEGRRRLPLFAADQDFKRQLIASPAPVRLEVSSWHDAEVKRGMLGVVRDESAGFGNAT